MKRREPGLPFKATAVFPPLTAGRWDLTTPLVSNGDGCITSHKDISLLYRSNELKRRIEDETSRPIKGIIFKNGTEANPQLL